MSELMVDGATGRRYWGVKVPTDDGLGEKLAYAIYEDKLAGLFGEVHVGQAWLGTWTRLNGNAMGVVKAYYTGSLHTLTSLGPDPMACDTIADHLDVLRIINTTLHPGHAQLTPPEGYEWLNDRASTQGKITFWPSRLLRLVWNTQFTRALQETNQPEWLKYWA